jgi:enamine deaminase RidA (YjgF/YER057c/UK114 family)
MDRKKINSGTLWESIVGYSRAIREGQHIFVSGTTATNKTGKIVGLNDPYAQTIQAIRNIEKALNGLGGSLNDVVRTRMYVVNITDDWEKVGRAHAELFDNVNLVTTMVEVNRLISPEMLIETEADAIVNDV